MKVDFMICGTQKGGTTALAAYLNSHPQIFIPEAKEVHFFDNEDYDWRFPDWSHYHVHFSRAKEWQICGEATPITMWWRPAMERLWRYNPHMKLIVLLRNPITRAFSHWNMEVQRGAEALGFIEAIMQERERCRVSLPLQHRVYSYVDRGFYVSQLREIWRFFPRSQLLVLRQEQLMLEPATALEDVYSFLGLASTAFGGSIIKHRRSYDLPMSRQALHFLRQTYWHEICQLQDLLDWDLADWLQLGS